MKKLLILLLLMIAILSCIGCGSKNNEVAFKTPIHNLQTINKKRTTDKIVFTNKGSANYHRSSCRHMGFTNGIKLSDAKKLGYMPCNVCNP